MDCYEIAICRKKGKSGVTWCTNYKFDIENRRVILYNVNGNSCGSINLEDLDFKRLDIYNAKRPMDPPVQTFLPRPEAI